MINPIRNRVPVKLRPERVCKKCEKSKDTRAFIGVRAVCRICWAGLNESERRENMTYANFHAPRSSLVASRQ
jgi:hypothetical protein